jgi:hypothetical protein
MAYATAADLLIPGVDGYSHVETGAAASHWPRNAQGWLPRHDTISAHITAAQKSPQNRVKPCSWNGDGGRLWGGSAYPPCVIHTDRGCSPQVLRRDRSASRSGIGGFWAHNKLPYSLPPCRDCIPPPDKNTRPYPWRGGQAGIRHRSADAAHFPTVRRQRENADLPRRRLWRPGAVHTDPRQ